MKVVYFLLGAVAVSGVFMYATSQNSGSPLAGGPERTWWCSEEHSTGSVPICLRGLDACNDIRERLGTQDACYSVPHVWEHGTPGYYPSQRECEHWRGVFHPSDPPCKMVK